MMPTFLPPFRPISPAQTGPMPRAMLTGLLRGLLHFEQRGIFMAHLLMCCWMNLALPFAGPAIPRIDPVAVRATGILPILDEKVPVVFVYFYEGGSFDDGVTGRCWGGESNGGNG